MEIDLGVKVKLTPEKAVVIGKTAVISDLHIGYEEALKRVGVYIPSSQMKEIKVELEKLLGRGIKKLVVAGDLKHEFGGNLPQEWKEIEEFVEFVTSRAELIVLRGNHDNFLKTILSKYGVDLVESYDAGIEILHGHVYREVKRAVMGHEHPSVKVRVRGVLYNYPCFLKVSDFIVLPAFSPLSSGSDVLTMDSFLSPILRKFNPEISEIYAVCEGVYYLGRVSELKKLQRYS